MVRRFDISLAMLCFAAFAPDGARSFQLAGWAGPRTSLHGVSRRRGVDAGSAAMRASANADADAGMSKEQKLKKYQQLAVEMTTKARKLPPGWVHAPRV